MVPRAPAGTVRFDFVAESVISVIIEEKYLELAVRSLHSAFGLDTVEVE